MQRRRRNPNCAAQAPENVSNAMSADILVAVVTSPLHSYTGWPPFRIVILVHDKAARYISVSIDFPSPNDCFRRDAILRSELTYDAINPTARRTLRFRNFSGEWSLSAHRSRIASHSTSLPENWRNISRALIDLNRGFRMNYCPPSCFSSSASASLASVSDRSAVCPVVAVVSTYFRRQRRQGVYPCWMASFAVRVLTLSLLWM
jgi:hypothetical protein